MKTQDTKRFEAIQRNLQTWLAKYGNLKYIPTNRRVWLRNTFSKLPQSRQEDLEREFSVRISEV